MAGGTFSITNFGSFGSVFATPVINQPQVAILGVGTVEKVPVVIDDAIAIRSQCYLALTFDHRLIDGALADQFTGKAKSDARNLVGRDSVMLQMRSLQIFLDCSVRSSRQQRGPHRQMSGAFEEDQIWLREPRVGKRRREICCSHLAGNVRQWIVAGVGVAPDTRDRDSEFNARRGPSKSELIAALRATVEEAIASSSHSRRRGSPRSYIFRNTMSAC